MYYGVEYQSVPHTVPVCGYFSLTGQKGIVRLSGQLNSAQYICILKDVFEVSKINEPNKLCIAHDWNPVHRSKAVKDYVSGNSIFCELDWPPNFGDVMPMERIWDKLIEDPTLEQKQKGKKVALSNEESLWNFIVNRWDAVVHSKCNEQCITNIIHGIPIKLRTIIDNAGGFSD